MKQDVTILVAEDDEGHFELIRKNLERAGVGGQILRFADGQHLLDFFSQPPGSGRDGAQYLIILDIRMPRLNGGGVLERLKRDRELRKIPVLVLTTADDPQEVERHHALGCGVYVVKPLDYDAFVDAIHRLGRFLSVVRFPTIEPSRVGRETCP